ncbi:hypothetical protein LTR10_019113 [Elasticomyces elasticus]|uniref:RING-type domain-containing protein n=1 Tax=Exophiala sideris TaxID=1016849 RepID=A0ABR0JJ39_9EURO|nr:hypothetical protein LTR10_019113 [Elasticomyces elasticus]KAK5033479.1 hypothetical protein LTS07_003783 [Exophiala sideris]KAK5042026.1 hypothetical protein LTR13_001832 [Exophiala sideris]KAK5064023.1 hypothetical protein LTR69_003791 [Exophiala sideris]KAK5185294.1 hypothetical protein LTR44_002283 [Eurotiomycetes sp. CCFEE 6388]
MENHALGNLEEMREQFPYGYLPPAYRLQRIQPNTDTRTVIEILSDDDSDPPNPAEPSPSNPPRHRRHSSRESANLPSAGDNMNFREQTHQESQSPHHKRARTGIAHGPIAAQKYAQYHHGFEQNHRVRYKAQPTLPMNPAHQPGYTGRERHSLTRPGPAVFSARPSGQIASNYYSKPKQETKPKEEPEKPPYYVDSLFDVKMYNGPGYERFPVVLGTVKGHKELCEKWDADQAKKLEKKAAKMRQKMLNAYVVHGSDSDSPDESDNEVGSKGSDDKCLQSVLEVFPDIEVAFVVAKIQAHGPQPIYTDEDDEIIELAAPPLAERIIAEILELDSYPKEVGVGSCGSRDAAPEDGTGITISWDRDLPKDDMYRKDAVLLLAKTFDHVPTHYIHNIVTKRKSIFDSYVDIQETEDQFYAKSDRPYGRLRQPRKEIEKKYHLNISDRRIPSQYSNRVNELQAARQHVAREAIQEAAKKAKEEAEAINLAKHKEMGALVECQCCFDEEIPLNRVVDCTADEPHFFCYMCVEGLADNQVGMLKYEMRCMDGSGCTAELSNEAVGKAIPILTFDRLALNKQQAEVRLAGIEGLEKCKWCDYQAVCDNVDKDPVFYCLNPECKRATCRKCEMDSHLPKTCEQNQQDNDLHGLHTVEEARSDAIMRSCPKCKVKILKEFGCNKMTCSTCNTIMCYVCNADLTALGQRPYDHFNKAGATCRLHDQEGVNRHEEEAMRAEIEAIKKAKEQNASIDESRLRVESGKEPKPKLDDHAAANVMYRGMNNRAGRLNNRQRRVQDLQARVAVMQDLLPDPGLEALLGRVHQREQHRQGRDPVPGQNPEMQLRPADEQARDREHRMRALHARMEELRQQHQVNVQAMANVAPTVPSGIPPMHMDALPQYMPPANALAPGGMNANMYHGDPWADPALVNNYNVDHNLAHFMNDWDVPAVNHVNHVQPGQQRPPYVILPNPVTIHRHWPAPFVAPDPVRDAFADPRRR